LTALPQHAIIKDRGEEIDLDKSVERVLDGPGKEKSYYLKKEKEITAYMSRARFASLTSRRKLIPKESFHYSAGTSRRHTLLRLRRPALLDQKRTAGRKFP